MITLPFVNLYTYTCEGMLFTVLSLLICYHFLVHNKRNMNWYSFMIVFHFILLVWLKNFFFSFLVRKSIASNDVDALTLAHPL